MFACFPTKRKSFLINSSDNVKSRCHFKIILSHSVFQLLSESNFSLEFSSESPL